jgi:lipoprotein-releasing system permease protein
MVKIAWKIAWRYLFAKKQFNAIHIVTRISSIAVGVVTAAMICVLSVMNGFGVMVEGMFSQFDAELRITHKGGKSFVIDDTLREHLSSVDGISLLSECVEETALIRFDEKQTPVRMIGVDSVFAELTGISQIITDGKFEVHDGAFDRAVLGQILAWKIGIGAHFVHGIEVYAPKRVGKVNMLRPDMNFNQGTCFISGTFAVNQQKYDEQVMLIDVNFARRLLEYDSCEVSALLVKTNGNTTGVKRALENALGEGYIVADRYEQQADFYRILRIEKLLTGLLLAFILLIATFNSIGALSMLMIDKKEDSTTLRYLGASEGLIRRIFLLEGWLVNILGALGGMVLGLALCLAQQHWGLLKLGSGSEYVIAAYPIAVEGMDVVLVMALVLALSFLTVWATVRGKKIKS